MTWDKFSNDEKTHFIFGFHDEKINTAVDMGDFQDQKIEAFKGYRSQLWPGDFRLRLDKPFYSGCSVKTN